MSTESQIQSFRDAYAALQSEIGKVIVGHTAIVESTLIALFGGGHVLLEGVPGLGKTLLIRTLGEVLDMPFNRIQFTPGGQMPSITLKGVSIKGTSKVQYEESVATAQADAQSALSQEKVPRAYQGAVRDYFDDLKK